MEHKEHHKREAIFLISFLLLFGIFFLFGIVNLQRGSGILGIMNDYVIENWIVIVLSFLSIIRVLVEIFRI